MDFFFPDECVNCGKEDVLLCEQCKTPIKNSIIHKVNNSNIGYYLFNYENEIIAKLIHRLKFYSCKKSLLCIEEIILNKISNIDLEDSIICPVPIHFFRKNNRGFNQSFLIAEIINKRAKNSKIIELVKKTKNTKPQRLCNKEDRLQNIKNSFIIKNMDYKNSKIVLVDDVYTTGSTINECINTLKQSGYKNIKFITLARKL